MARAGGGRRSVLRVIRVVIVGDLVQCRLDQRDELVTVLDLEDVVAILVEQRVVVSVAARGLILDQIDGRCTLESTFSLHSWSWASGTLPSCSAP